MSTRHLKSYRGPSPQMVNHEVRYNTGRGYDPSSNHSVSPAHSRRAHETGRVHLDAKSNTDPYHSAPEDTHMHTAHTSVGFVVANAESESSRCGYMREPPIHPSRAACSMFRLLMLLICSCSCVIFGAVLATIFLIPVVRMGDRGSTRVSIVTQSANFTTIHPDLPTPRTFETTLLISELIQRLSILVQQRADGASTLNWAAQPVLFPHWSAIGSVDDDLDYRAVIADILILISHNQLQGTRSRSTVNTLPHTQEPSLAHRSEGAMLRPTLVEEAILYSVNDTTYRKQSNV